MIRNERQYKITKQRVSQFEEAIASLREKDDPTEWDKVELDALTNQSLDLGSEINEYDQLKSGGIAVLEMDSFDELPDGLVRARIAAGLTQRELAEKLGLKEQQIQRYEQNSYAGASIDRIREVIDALGIKVSKRFFLPNTSDSLARVYQRLQTVGLNRDFIDSRLITTKYTKANRSGRDEEAQVMAEVAERVSRIYGWSPQEITGDFPLMLTSKQALAARFKLPQRVDERKVAAYTIYAHYLALLGLHACEARMRVVDLDPVFIRAELEKHWGRVSFNSVLHFVWELGIPVIPLKDEGAFHGACWRVNGRSVIVLKQRTTSEARWTIDLLHELYHAMQNPDAKTLSIVEAPEGAVLDGIAQDEEIEATEFAGDVLLQNRADELALMCQREARGKVQFLKRAVERVASREGVEIGVLANYMAYRLALQGTVNWWGAASNLQSTTVSPWEVARDVLIQKIDFSRLSPTDQVLFRNALCE